MPETVRAENDEKLKAYDIEVSENEKSIQDLAKLIWFKKIIYLYKNIIKWIFVYSHI